MEVKKRMLPIILIAVFCLMLMGTQVYAAKGDPAINMGPAALKKNVNQDGVQVLWYGGEAWQVIGYDAVKNSAVSRKGAVTVLHRESADPVMFNAVNDTDRSSAYGGSDLQKFLDGWLSTGKNARFSAGEQRAILPRTLEGGGSDFDPENPGNYDGDKIKGASVQKAYLWPLSVTEAKTLSAGIVNTGKYYWLRSPGMVHTYTKVPTYNAAVVWTDFQQGEIVAPWGLDVNTEDGLNVRPAFGLDKDKVLFVSAARNGKSSPKTGINALTRVKTNDGDDWKVTVADDTHKGFKVTYAATTSSSQMKFSYTGARIGANEYVSAVVKNTAGKITFYGRIRKCDDKADAADTLKINFGDKAKAGETLYIFNEQVNSDLSDGSPAVTDYASGLYSMKIPRVIAGAGNPTTGKTDETLRLEARNITTKAKTLKKRALIYKRSRVIRISNAHGKLTYRLTGVRDSNQKKYSKYKKYFYINPRNGNVTLKKGLRKGLYQMSVRVTCAGDKKVRKNSKTVSVQVKVK